MRTRVGTLEVGARFVTLLTGRQGRVLDRAGASEYGVLVRLAGDVGARPLHPGVLVLAQ